jgi:hypothetical protein
MRLKAFISVLAVTTLVLAQTATAQQQRSMSQLRTAQNNDAPAAASAPRFLITVGQHNAIPTPISDTEVDKILDSLSSLFAHENPACRASFVRDGPISKFDNKKYPFAINSETDFNKFKADPPSLKIVGEINWCSGLGIGIIGCSSTPGPAWTVVRYTPVIEHLLWAHEFGHTTGLIHRDVPNALMRPTLYESDTEINGDECTHIQAGSPPVHPNIGAAGLDGPPTSSSNEETPQAAGSAPGTTGGPPEPVSAFVQGGWVEGVPYNLAKLYTDEDVPALSSILGDQSKSSLWRNAVGTLGAIGTSRAKYALMVFLLRDPNAELSAAEYIGKSNVPVALGWLVERSLEDKKVDLAAIDLLLKMTNANWWVETAKINWKTPIHASPDELITSLLVKASIGCALSKTEECKVRLVQLGKSVERNPPSPPSSRESAFVTKSLGTSAIQTIEKVSPSTRDAIKGGGGNSLIRSLLGERARVMQSQGGLEGYYTKTDPPTR